MRVEISVHVGGPFPLRKPSFFFRRCEIFEEDFMCFSARTTFGVKT